MLPPLDKPTRLADLFDDPSTEKATRFLVVDDIESMRKLIIRNLGSMGYVHSYQAANGSEAMRMLDNNPLIEVVITDWNMPVSSGLDLLRAIREHATYRRLPVLMVTAEISRDQVIEAAEAGVSDFLVKPFTAGILQAKIGKMMFNLQRGVVNGLKVEQMAASGKKGDAPGAANLARASTMSTPVLGESDSARCDGEAEPPALVFTGDLQARMSKQASILVVDDVPDNIDVLVGLLQDEYKVLAARSGELALKMLANAKVLPDLILLDVMMPEMDGFEVCRRIKANSATAGIPVIFLTATDDAANLVQGLELGALDYVTKPANPTILKARVATHLTRSKAFAELKKQNQVMAENIRLREDVERMTAHDLKNPLGGIINFTDMLLTEGTTTPDQKEMLGAIEESARNLLNMVNLSLDLFKIEQGKYELQATRVDIAHIANKQLSQSKAEIDAKKLKVVVLYRKGEETFADDKPFHAIGDELLCYSLLGNLIRNAVEASPPGGRLSLTYAVTAEGMASLEMTNNGAVPKEIRASFFGKYVTAGKKGGTGLGAYSAKLLTDVQQGRLAMSVDDGKGETTMALELPRPT